jgi:cbb3-type cytochrome oxidase maturation protein
MRCASRAGVEPMESLYLLIPLSLAIVGAAAGVFVWACSSGQFDDLEKHGRLPDD